MTTTYVYPWYSPLPQDIIDRAYETHGEPAWVKADALRGVRLLRGKGYQVRGIDTWLPTRPGPTPLIEDWDERQPISAIDFIETFQRKEPVRSHCDLMTHVAIVA